LPAGAMFLTVLAFNMVGDLLRALTDPRPGAL
jgi:peptide/nickel transport system permease protein